MTLRLRSLSRLQIAFTLQLSLVGLASCASDDSAPWAPAPPPTSFPDDASSATDAAALDAGAQGDAPSATDAAHTSDAPKPPPPFVRGLSIGNIAIFQGVKVFLVKGGADVTPTNAPIIANRPGRLRVYVTADASWQTHDIVAELHLTTAGAPLVITQTVTVNAGSNLSPIDFDLTAAQLPENVAYSIALRDPTMPSGDVDGGVVNGGIVGGRYPIDGTTASLHAIGKSVLKLQLVPVRYDADGSGRTPNFDAATIANYHDTLFKMYPVSEIEITVHAPMPYGQYIGATDGWDQLLGAVASLRSVDNPSPETYYLGAFEPADTFGAFCGGGCYAGLGYIASADAIDQHAAIVLGYSGDIGPSTSTQEIAHAMGRLHAPCGNPGSVDGDYPYGNASIGVYGFDVLKKEFVDPSKYVDFMSYCSPIWTSDYTFKALSDRITTVNSTMRMQPLAARLPAQPVHHEIVDLRKDGALRWSRAMPMTAEPSGEPIAVRFVDATGRALESATAHLVRYDAFEGGMLILPAVPKGTAEVVVAGLGRGELRARRDVH
jgi:hypothetical protein